MLLALVAAVPRVLGTAGAVVQQDAAGVASAWRTGGRGRRLRPQLQVLGVVLPDARVLPHPRTHRAALVPRTRALEPRILPEASRRDDAQHRGHRGPLLGLVAGAGHLPADRPGREGAAHRLASRPRRALRHPRHRRGRPRCSPVGPRPSVPRPGSGWPMDPRSRRPSRTGSLSRASRPAARDGARPERRSPATASPPPARKQPNPGSSRSTSPCRPQRATTRRRLQHHRRLVNYDVAFALVWARATRCST